MGNVYFIVSTKAQEVFECSWKRIYIRNLLVKNLQINDSSQPGSFQEGLELWAWWLSEKVKKRASPQIFLFFIFTVLSSSRASCVDCLDTPVSCDSSSKSIETAALVTLLLFKKFYNSIDFYYSNKLLVLLKNSNLPRAIIWFMKCGQNHSEDVPSDFAKHSNRVTLPSA